MSRATVRVIGVRHHSPACARLVAEAIERERPQAVLIEGPSDFNPRLGELLLDHQLPLALYSYANDGERPAQSWFPLLDYSPEWVALRRGHAAGAVVRFMDLPHWRYRTLPEAMRRTAAQAQRRSRYAQVVAGLCARFGCDGDDALWDHLFESLAPDASGDELSKRLDLYFAELRGDEAGDAEDQARESHMADWLAWAAGTFERVLVVCGGWHKPALERALATAPARAAEPEAPRPADERAAGCYLVPFEYRQVDALGGYRSGLPSPMYYQWAWQHGLRAAGERATARVVSRLRGAQVALSTADLLALHRTGRALADLRGHAVPLRVDLLDALQSVVVKEAMDAPSPWSRGGELAVEHHPVLREALLALTGEGAGRLHGDTPLPPLLHDVQQRMAGLQLTAETQAQKLVLDRRRAEDAPRARLLWQLHGLKVGGVRLTQTRAPRAARGLAQELAFEEHWQVQRDARWYPDLIEASVHGATLESAARQCLLIQAAEAGGDAGALARCLVQAIRAGLLDIGQDLAHELQAGLAASHDHGALARAVQSLVAIVQAGFWGEDPRELLEDTLALMAERLLWLLEGRDGSGGGNASLLENDVGATAVFDQLLRLHLRSLDTGFALQTLVRLAHAPSKPPALRGAALGVACRHDALAGGDARAAQREIAAMTRSMPPRDALGDFLYGLFSCARAQATESDGIVRAVHAAIDGMGIEDFLVALPALRSALGWFPPRERGALAAHVAAVLGLDAGQRQRLLSLRAGGDALLDARRIEAQAMAWAGEMGLIS